MQQVRYFSLGFHAPSQPRSSWIFLEDCLSWASLPIYSLPISSWSPNTILHHVPYSTIQTYCHASNCHTQSSALSWALLYFLFLFMLCFILLCSLMLCLTLIFPHPKFVPNFFSTYFPFKPPFFNYNAIKMEINDKR